MEVILTHTNKATCTKILLKICILILLLYFYSLGLQKCIALSSYRFWLNRVPVAKTFSDILYIIIPVLQLLLAAMLLHKKTRMAALYYIIISQLAYVVLIGYIFYFTPYLVWPWHPFWTKADWFEILLLTLSTAWLAFVSLKLHMKLLKIEKRLF
ncbi:MauE/DoxX family redox-associated membrane protein [Niabella beijingensis]|uniref:MauE/DoxX family redox-associated membrane protein n=1 Tax=Niabella beijingensis TaxID=2872700 RepID=UPI003B84AE46